jgi:hypothetical protein
LAYFRKKFLYASFNILGLKACLDAREPVPEEPFEISSDVHGSIDGPRTGRLRAMEKVCMSSLRKLVTEILADY